MMHTHRGLGVAATLGIALSLAVVPQARSQSTSAHVYVQTQGPAGPVYEYSANSNGQLAPISGSPFKPGTQIVGGNGSQFFTLGKTLIHSFSVASNGAVGSQLSQVPIFDYAGSSCGSATSGKVGAVLDHTGKTIYTMIDPNGCVAYQSYAINGDGSFTFGGDTEEPQSLYGSDLENVSFGLPTILGNETFAYAEYPKDSSGNGKLIGFRRGSSGTLELMQFSETDPGGTMAAAAHDPDASPKGNYVVVQVNSSGTSPTYLASYSVDSQGNLSTTNTYSNMPTTTLVPNFNTSSQSAMRSNSAFSPSGNLFAVYGGAGTPGSAMNGIEIYNFNGSAPLTLYKKILTGAPIDDVAWDNSNHLYAISNSANTIYVFTVTSTNVVEDMTLSLAYPVRLVVVSQVANNGGGGACAAPSSNGVNVCSPADGATVSSPVQISAAATVSGGVYRFELWSGGKKLLSSDSGTIDQPLSLAPGTYKLTFDAYNINKSVHVYATRNITVQ